MLWVEQTNSQPSPPSSSSVPSDTSLARRMRYSNWRMFLPFPSPFAAAGGCVGRGNFSGIQRDERTVLAEPLFPSLEQPIDGRAKLPVGERFCDIAVAPALQALLSIPRPGQRCRRQYRNILGPGILSYAGGGLKAVQLRHDDVHDNQIGRLRGGLFHRLLPVLREHHLVAQDIEFRLHHLHGSGVVFREEHAFLRVHIRHILYSRSGKVARFSPFPCYSNVTLSGVNGNVIMSGYGKHHSPEDGRAEASRSYAEGL